MDPSDADNLTLIGYRSAADDPKPLSTKRVLAAVAIGFVGLAALLIAALLVGIGVGAVHTAEADSNEYLIGVVVASFFYLLVAAVAFWLAWRLIRPRRADLSHAG